MTFMKRLLVIFIFVIMFLPSVIFAEEGRILVPDYSWYESADKETYTISSEEQLLGFANIVNGKAESILKDTFNGKVVYLSKNLDLTGVTWTPIGSSMYEHSAYDSNTKMFEGTFDGGYHTITGLSSKNYVVLAEDIGAGEHSYGLFGYAYGASVKNLNLANVDIHCSGEAGADGAGVAAVIGFYVPKDDQVSVIENVHVLSGEVQATNNMGGVIGYTEIMGTEVNIDITIENCTNSAKVITDAREAGGIMGLFQNAKGHSGTLKFINCINYGDVIANPGAAATVASGILGKEQTYSNGVFEFVVYFENCINEGNVIANGKSGSGTETHAAGISTVYYVRGTPLIVKNCLNTGSVTITGESVDNFIDGVIAHPSSNIYRSIRGVFQDSSYNLGTLTAPKSNTIFLKYDVNGGTGYEDPSRVAYGTTLIVPGGNNLSRDGYIFAGWNTKIDGTGDKYVEGSSITINDSTTLYAQWKKDNGTWSAIAPPVQFYTGESIKPNVLVYDKDGNKIDIGKYTVTYPKDFDCIDIGKKEFKVTYNGETLELDYTIIKSRADIKIIPATNELKGNEILELYVPGAEYDDVEVICDDPDVVIQYGGNNVFNVIMPNKDKDYLFTVIAKNENNYEVSSSVLVTGVKVNDVVENPNTKDYKFVLFIVPVMIVLLFFILDNMNWFRKDQYERY